jgi:hypothetical protein
MKSITQGFAGIGASLLIFISIAALGATAVQRSLFANRQMGQAHREATGQRSEIQAKLSRVAEETQEIRDKLKRYEELMARGYIGNENRLDWVEEIRRITVARRLLSVEYDLAPQKRINEAADGTTGGYDFMASNMKLQMLLLHEEDLLNFLDDLRTSVSAYLRINSCNVERLPPPTEKHGAVALLKADCSIDWITLREKK